MTRLIRLKIMGSIVACAFWLAGSAAAADFVVIVNAENPVSALSRKGVSRMLLGKTSEWEDGVAVTAVDLPLDNATRGAFSEHVHKKRSDQGLLAAAGVLRPRDPSERDG